MIVSLVVLLSGQWLAAPVALSIKELVTERDIRHSAIVSVEGTIADLKAKTSRKGNAYTVFTLVDAGTTISVYSRGRIAESLTDGARARVVGRFEKEHFIGSSSIKNQVDATSSPGRPYGVSPGS